MQFKTFQACNCPLAGYDEQFQLMAWGGDEGIKLNLSTTKTKLDYKKYQWKSHHLSWPKKYVEHLL